MLVTVFDRFAAWSCLRSFFPTDDNKRPEDSGGARQSRFTTKLLGHPLVPNNHQQHHIMYPIQIRVAIQTRAKHVVRSGTSRFRSALGRTTPNYAVNHHSVSCVHRQSAQLAMITLRSAPDGGSGGDDTTQSHSRYFAGLLTCRSAKQAWHRCTLPDQACERCQIRQNRQSGPETPTPELPPLQF